MGAGGGHRVGDRPVHYRPDLEVIHPNGPSGRTRARLAWTRMRGKAEEDEMPGIITGIDGSGHSQRALEWAVREAAAWHVPLMVITVYQAVADAWGS
jgi:hypothetical protein